MASRSDDVQLLGGAWSNPDDESPPPEAGDGTPEIDPLDAFRRDHAPQVSDDVLQHYKVILPGLPPRLDVPAPSQSPWSGVVLLNFRQRGVKVTVGTGFFCQPDVILTAGHNLDRAYDALYAYPAFDARTNPHVGSYAIVGWARHPVLDLAVFLTSEASGDVFALGGGLPPPHAGVTLSGYSFPYAGGDARYSYGVGAVVAAGSDTLSYMINTRGGDSGAPVFTVLQGGPVAFGVHTEAAALPGLGNGGVLMSPAVVAQVHRMVAHARGQVGR
jgi:hypothetical protein